jgi:hypothetical protein
MKCGGPSGLGRGGEGAALAAFARRRSARAPYTSELCEAETEAWTNDARASCTDTDGMCSARTVWLAVVEAGWPRQPGPRARTCRCQEGLQLGRVL